jgi:hypothetical protein
MSTGRLMNELQGPTDDRILQRGEPPFLLWREPFEIGPQRFHEKQLRESTQEGVGPGPSGLGFRDDVIEVGVQPFGGRAIVPADQQEGRQGREGWVEAARLELQHSADEAQGFLSRPVVDGRWGGHHRSFREKLGALHASSPGLVDHRVVQVVQDDDQVPLLEAFRREPFDLDESPAGPDDVEHRQTMMVTLGLHRGMKERRRGHDDSVRLPEVGTQKDDSRQIDGLKQVGEGVHQPIVQHIWRT